MKRKETTSKIYPFLGILFFIVMGIVLFVVHSNTNTIVSRLTSNQAQTANQAFVSYLNEFEHVALEKAESIAGSKFVVDYVKNRNYEMLGRILADFGEGIDSAAVCNPDGIVLVRRHSDKAGDDVSWYTPVSETLKTGFSSSTLGSTKSFELAAFATAAVYDGETLIGVVACIFDLTKSGHLDTFKARNGCEATIIYDGERINTTIHDKNGNRITGTKADARIAETVIGNQTDYSGRLEIFDIMYQIYCSPLIVDGEKAGMLFTGINIDSALSDQRNMNYIIILIAIIAFVASGAVFIASHRFTRMHENVLEELSDKSAALHILETLLNAIDIFIHVTDLETDRILFANDRFKEHFGLSGDIIGEICWKIFGEARCDLCPKERLMANPGESITWEEYKNITGRYYRTTARIIDWPDENKVVFHYRIDINNEKKIEIEKLDALEKAEQANRAKSDLQHYASTDALTGVFNRKWGTQLLLQEHEAARVAGTPISLCFIDFDRLKELNDTSGHDAGDKAIINSCEMIRKRIRKDDIFCRWGGDEFVVLLKCELDRADAIMRGIRDELSSSTQETYALPRLMFSYGIVDFTTADTVDAAITAADRLMYDNKNVKRKH